MIKSIKIDFARNLDLAKKIFDLLSLDLNQNNILKNSDLELNEDQCSIIINTKSSNLSIVKKMTKNIMQNIFENDANLFDYKITDFENIIIVAKNIDLEKITDFLSCEICGYKTIYEEELFIHRYTHAGL
ncbi:MAG: hypothetical protein ACE5SW_02375 [Nitrososphaeraceae archaeon]